LCLPQCPTYRETGHEGHSPRGRIALVQGLVTGLVPATATLEQQLDGCLSCRRCEAVCPALVSYSRVLDGGRARLAKAKPSRVRVARWMSAFLSSSWGPWWLRWSVRAVAAMRVPGRWGRYARAAATVARDSTGSGSIEFRAAEKSIEPGAMEIRLFEGCVTRALEGDVLEAARTLLTAAGYRVVESPDQTCCGALARHAGLADEGEQLARRNVVAFAGTAPIASITSGCAATLKDAADFDLAGAAAFAARVQDHAPLLLARADRLHFTPLPLRVALHEPCTLTNVLKSGDALRTLLRRIPGITLVDLDPGGGCCGAAGTYCLDQPAMADRLLDRKVTAIAALQPDLVLSSNVGCTMHLVAGLQRGGLRTAERSASRPARETSQAPKAEPSGTASWPAATGSAPVPAVRHPVALLASLLASHGSPPPRA
jgi:glycolate oxidase iron-sulfur subunit